MLLFCILIYFEMVNYRTHFADAHFLLIFMNELAKQFIVEQNELSGEFSEKH